MKIEQLRQLLEVFKTKSINQAAANLYISQPNLSLSLRNLEAELGYPLVERNNRGVAFTAQGEQFLEYAESVLKQFDHLKALYRHDPSTPKNSFSLANMQFRYVNEAASILYMRHKQNEPFRLILNEAGRDSILELVYNGSAEIGIIGIWSQYKRIVSSQLKARDCQFFHLTSNPLSVVVGKGNPLYYAEEDLQITPEMLESYPFASYAKEDYGSFLNPTEIIENWEISSRIIANSRSALYEILEHTDAFTIMATNRQAYSRAKYYPAARSFILSGKHGNCEVGWIKRRDYSPSPIALEFIQLLTTYYA